MITPLLRFLLTKDSVPSYVCSVMEAQSNSKIHFRKIGLLIGILLALFILIENAQAQEKNVFIYGDVETVSGEVYTGFIRWGNDEVYWVELLNAKKTSNDFLKFLSEREIKALAEESGENSWLGIDLGILSIWEDRISRTNHQFDTRFGDIASIEPAGRSRARIRIKNGVIIEVAGEGYSDIGGDVTIRDLELGEVTIKWNRIEKVTFKPAPSHPIESFGEPIFGTVDAGRKGSFTGLIQWDVDERFLDEILDGEDRGDDRKIPFKSIKSIEKDNNSVLVRLNSGREFQLSGSNDVNNENRGIVVFDAEIGSVLIPWREFRMVEFFNEKATGLSYTDFTVSKGLSGTVRTIEGSSHAGLLVFDLDESWEFEILDGRDDKVEYDIPFSNVERIVPKNYNFSLVTLKNGREILIGDERDVTSANDGILVFPSRNEEPIYIQWSKIEEIIFNR